MWVEIYTLWPSSPEPACETSCRPSTNLPHWLELRRRLLHPPMQLHPTSNHFMSATRLDLASPSPDKKDLACFLDPFRIAEDTERLESGNASVGLTARTRGSCPIVDSGEGFRRGHERNAPFAGTSLARACALRPRAEMVDPRDSAATR